MNISHDATPKMNIVAIKVANRSTSAAKVQQLLTQYGCYIKTRIGFHHTAEDHCAEDGLIILQMVGGCEVTDELIAKLNVLEQVQAKYVAFP